MRRIFAKRSRRASALEPPELKNPEREMQYFRRRMSIAGVLVIVAFGGLASHLIGYIGRINERDVKRIDEWDETANYKGSDYIGKSGVELSYERELHGTTGVEQVEVDAGGRAVRTLSRTPPISGNNVTLSLDIRLQQAAEA